MWDTCLEEHVVNLYSENEKGTLVAFLEKQRLSFDKEIEYSMVLTDNGKIVATGSFSYNVLKCLAVDDEYKGMGLSSRVITHLSNEQYRRGRTHLFVFTKPENKGLFAESGLYTIAEVPSKVTLMENRQDGINKYLEEISCESGTIIPSAAVVVNCNPFTLGHKYLLEYAAARCRRLHIFMVWEERSVFPSEIRYRLVKEGVAHLSNVVVHKGKDYIISNATFPSYFLKQKDDMAEIHARLDITVFLQHIAKKLDIKNRYVGEEPYDIVTSVYNKVMGEMLPAAGIQLEVVPRLTSDGIVISASRVREMIRNGNIHGTKGIVSENTYNFLLSKEAEGIIKNIQSSNSRH